MTGSKPWYQSKTIIGLFLLLFGVLANRSEWNFGGDEKAALEALILNATTLVGSVLAFWGRLKAKTTLTKT